MGKNVLVVDDAAFMRMKIIKLLTENGYQVIGEAGNGEEAVSKYQQLRPDLVIMDITMPIMDGITAINEIKKLDDSAKVIVCSAMGQQNMVIQAIKSGAKDYVLKPFQPDRVLEAVKKQVG
ncbi:MAG: response regulator [Actinomycetota bacterium]|mgnify:CR=1 FL=1|nr:response regulator [Actinomycetota bacterium]